ncbi:hypothetical protein ACMFMG_012171 [Clarireedia jacksonii]
MKAPLPLPHTSPSPSSSAYSSFHKTITSSIAIRIHIILFTVVPATTLQVFPASLPSPTSILHLVVPPTRYSPSPLIPSHPLTSFFPLPVSRTVTGISPVFSSSPHILIPFTPGLRKCAHDKQEMRPTIINPLRTLELNCVRYGKRVWK